MPRNRRPQDREEKRAEIVAAARTLFTERGYDAVSVASIARAAGVVSNTVYWYFPDKDAVLISVLDVVLAESMQRFEAIAGADLAERLVWVVDELAQLSGLVTTVHARAEESAVVRDWHDRFHALTEGLFRLELTELGLAEADLDAVISMGVFVIEGLLMHSAARTEQRAVVSTLVRSIRGLAMSTA
ncbi:TetR/AcrR family transcriptional regulator [Nocardia wallacei]|uniref:TetR/AcrR family transcriptional regulator n=1 Tax=Nocardia wallacei TaxID=480035 RepID=UPI002455FC81|nr:helix-turn-helix domain-containing protein [Nocardia wallacei]